MKNKEETLLKSEVKAEFVRGIELWLESSERDKQKKNRLPFGSWQRESYRVQSSTYFSMAQALFLTGRSLGLLTCDDYPMFKTSTDTEKEGK